MRVEIERSMECACLMIHIEDYQRTFEEDMLKGQIPGVLNMSIKNNNEEVQFVYDITQKVSFTEYMERIVFDVVWIRKLLDSIITILIRAKEYLLEEDCFYLTQDSIFVGNNGESIWLSYVPGYHYSLKQQFTELFEAWMKRIDYSDKKTVELVYEMHRISRQETCTFEQLQSCIRKKLVQSGDELEISLEDSIKSLAPKDTMKQPYAMGVVGLSEEMKGEKEVLYYPKKLYLYMIVAGGLLVCSFLVANVFGVFLNHYQELDYLRLFAFIIVGISILLFMYLSLFQEKRKLSRMIPTIEHISFEQEAQMDTNRMQQNPLESYDDIKRMRKVEEDTKLLHVQEETNREETTQLLCEDKTELLYVKTTLLLKPREDTNEPIQIESNYGMIGSSKASNIICIPCKTISRRHAKITKESGVYFVEDLESTNGTYINGKRLEKGRKERLNQGDILTFAEHTYEACIQEPI